MIKLMAMVILFTAMITGCSNENNKPEENYVQEELPNIQANTNPAKAPDFTLTSTDGKKVNLQEYKGKIVILDFWATWCPPCRKGIPDLVELQKQYKDDLVIIGISLDQETKPDVVPFMKEYGINYPVVYGDMKVVQSYGNIQSIPTSFIIDSKGNIVDMHVGLVPKSVYDDQIKALLGKS